MSSQYTSDTALEDTGQFQECYYYYRKILDFIPHPRERATYQGPRSKSMEKKCLPPSQPGIEKGAEERRRYEVEEMSKSPGAEKLEGPTFHSTLSTIHCLSDPFPFLKALFDQIISEFSANVGHLHLVKSGTL